MKRVRVGRLYRYKPVLLDRAHPPYNVREGDIVRVVNLPGCPKAGTMGHCHVEHLNGDFAGLVCCNSLEDLNASERKATQRHAAPTAAVPVSPSAWQRLFEANKSEHMPPLRSRNDHTAARKTLRKKRPSRTSR
jgi:hypothetical protein